MTTSSPARPLQELAERFWRFQCYEFPVTAIAAGETLSDATLFREAPADYDRRHDAALLMLDELAQISPERLSSQERATHQLLRFELRAMRDLYDARAHQRPMLFPFGPAFGTVGFANTANVTNAQEAKLYNERLATIPAFLRDVEANFEAGQRAGMRYPRVAVELALGNLRAAIGAAVDELAWFSPYSRVSLGQTGIERHAEQCRKYVADTLVPALAAHADFIETALGDGARTTISCTDAPAGAAFYGVLTRLYTTTDLEPHEIHDLGLIEVERIGVKMDDVAAQAGYGGRRRDYQRWLSSNPDFVAASKDALREQAQLACKQIDRHIPRFFGHLPRITYGVESMPEALSQRMPPAYAQPNLADGRQSGIYWITALPERFPMYMMLPIALHEAWPGHLMHIALMQEQDGLPAFRRNGAMKYIACVEGWAMYCESLGIDMGLYETPHQRFGQLDGEMWRALRLVVDTGIHSKGWNREQAIVYMADRQTLPLATITAEVDRYIAMPGQALAYQVGNRKLHELRLEALKRLGERFDIRAFHDAVMAVGPVTMGVLEEVIRDWIDRS